MVASNMEESKVMNNDITSTDRIQLEIKEEKEVSEVEGKKTPFSKNNLLAVSLIDFFKEKKHFDCLRSIIEGKSNLSLRILDWFVTNHAKKDNIMYTCKGVQFIVYLNYKSQLKAYSKRQFDPFCRRDRIILKYTLDEQEQELTTTIGQLNFFRWALLNNVIDYVIENIDDIEQDMYQSCRRNVNKKKRPNDTTRKRRTELSKSATKSISRHSVSVTVSFD